ncbi:MAG: hypothetical protein M9963_01285 [Kiritimatiellae bacterium]|nr:hypothetical protein [Kiritimatiellia bacterium]
MATPLALIGLLWVGMTSMDWVLRFTWFHWDRMFFASAAQPRYMGDAKPLSVVNIEPKVGGDLAQMLGHAALADGLAVEHPGGYQLFTDEYGLPMCRRQPGPFSRLCSLAIAIFCKARECPIRSAGV